MDYGEIVGELEDFEKANLEKLDWWNPGVGKHKVLLLSEISEPYTQKYEGQDIVKHRIKVKVGDKVLLWSFSRGKTKSSLFGQLAVLGNAWKSLKDKEITLLVKSDGKKKEYTVLEAMDFVTSKGEKTEGQDQSGVSQPEVVREVVA